MIRRKVRPRSFSYEAGRRQRSQAPDPSKRHGVVICWRALGARRWNGIDLGVQPALLVLPTPLIGALCRLAKQLQVLSEDPAANPNENQAPDELGWPAIFHPDTVADHHCHQRHRQRDQADDHHRLHDRDIQHR